MLMQDSTDISDALVQLNQGRRDEVERALETLCANGVGTNGDVKLHPYAFYDSAAIAAKLNNGGNRGATFTAGQVDALLIDSITSRRVTVVPIGMVKDNHIHYGYAYKTADSSAR